jgi:hypothetical protein
MNYAIEILEIELYSWKEIYNSASKEMAVNPNQYSDNALSLSALKIKELESAINKLKLLKNA